MRDIEDLATDIASIVTSCKLGERMTLSKIEEIYRSMYNCRLPYHEYGYNCLERLLSSFPQYFKFSEADGILIVHTYFENEITQLIKTETTNNKSVRKPIQIKDSSSGIVFRKHRRKQQLVEPELPVIMIKEIVEMINQVQCIEKWEFLSKFQRFAGYELKYADYGFASEDKLLQYVGEVACIIRNNRLYCRIDKNQKTLYQMLREIVKTNTGFTASNLQDRLIELITNEDESIRSEHCLWNMMRMEGMVNFNDLIYAGCNKKLLSYDFDLVYPYYTLDSVKDTFTGVELNYPPGVNQILIHNAISPSKFYFEIIDNQSYFSRQLLHDRLQQTIASSPLLINFKENRFCCVEYDGVWYRVKITDIYTANRGRESVTVHFMDHPIQVGLGIKISLPTDRLRFTPRDLRDLPAFFHRGSLAYIKPSNSTTNWTKDACDTFLSLAMDNHNYHYEAFLVDQTNRNVIIDVIASLQTNNNNMNSDDNYDSDNCTSALHNSRNLVMYSRHSIFHRMIELTDADFDNSLIINTVVVG